MPRGDSIHKETASISFPLLGKLSQILRKVNMKPELIEYLDTLIGIPYKINGRDQEGIDCIGVVIAFYRDFLEKEFYDNSIDVPEGWYDDPDYAQYMEKLIKTHGTWVDEPQDFDIVLIAPRDHFLANHMGIYLPGGKILNTNEKSGVCINPLHLLEEAGVIKGYIRFYDQT